MNQTEIDEIGDFLEHQGMTDEMIDEFFEHHGVKGQKWGVRRRQNRALNKASRQKDRAERVSAIESARAERASGKLKRDVKTAKKNFDKNKLELGSREARKIIKAAKQRKREQAALSWQAKNGKEVAVDLLFGPLVGMIYKSGGAD